MRAPAGGAREGAEARACELETHPDFRVLRRLQPMVRRSSRESCAVVGVAVDVETTGLDHRVDAVIELAMQRFYVDGEGRIVASGRPHRWLEDPGVPLPRPITELTGISDEDVRGRRINDAVAAGILRDSDFVIAHNARFDRPFVEARLPEAAGLPWACSMADVDWRGRGFEGRSLSYLVAQTGRFYSAHRADVDVSALLHLLDHEAEDGRGTVLAEVLATAARPIWSIEAVGAPFDAKDRLKARGYRWEPERKLWATMVPGERFDDEIEWCVAEVYGGTAKPRFREVSWRQRFAADAQPAGVRP